MVAHCALLAASSALLVSPLRPAPAPRVAAAERGGPRRCGLERVAALGPVGVVVVLERVELLRDGAVGALRGGEAQQAPHEDRLARRGAADRRVLRAPFARRTEHGGARRSAARFRGRVGEAHVAALAYEMVEEHYGVACRLALHEDRALGYAFRAYEGSAHAFRVFDGYK